MGDQNYKSPYAEDYTSDDGQNNNNNNGVPIDALTPDTSPGKSNIRTKRSHPEGVGNGTPTAKGPNFDVKSDSGYSSQSVAGMSSADSAASATSQRSPPVVPAAPSPTPQRERGPRPTHQRQQSSQSAQSSQAASRHPLTRRDSHASQQRPAPERRPTISRQQAPAPRRRDSRNVDDTICTKPGCNCGADAPEPRPRQSRRQSMLQTQPAESAPDVSRQRSYDTRSQVSDPANYYPPSPVDGGRSSRGMYHGQQGGPVIEPAMSRRLSVNQRPARPTSYHAGVGYNMQQPGMHTSYPSPPQDHGPPPSRSGYANMNYPQPPMHSPYMQYPPLPQGPPAAFLQAQAMQPTRDSQRPPPPQARASQTLPYGHPAQAPMVQVERSDRTMPSARYHSNAPPRRRPQGLEYREPEDHGSESESESEEENFEPERPQPRSSKRRPTLPHANTTPAPLALESRRPQAVIVPERRDTRDTRVRERTKDSRSNRRSSMSRPPLVPAIKSESAYDAPRARVIVEGSRSSRRESLQAYDKTFTEHQRRTRQQEYNEQPRTKRSSRIYDNVVAGHDYERDYHDDDDEPAPVARAPLRRRGTDAEPRRRPRPVEVRQAADAEDYINARRGERDTLADQSYAIAKTRSSRTSGVPSEPGSSHSSRSDNNGEIRLRIGNDAPVTLSLNGDMEGRTLQLVPIENGMNELVISGNGRSAESTYRSERGSTRGERKAIMSASQSRREAEEMTERSLHSTRRRRETRGEQDEPRRVLRQVRRERREPEYH
jgi:hypothetical protein